MFYIIIFLCIINISNGSIKYDSGNKPKLNREFGKLASDIVAKYFKHLPCIFIITDRMFQESFLPHFILPFNISIINVKTSQEKCSLKYMHFLELGFSQSCTGYIVQLELPLCFVNTLEKVISNSVYRQHPRLLFLPTETKPIISTDLFPTRQLEFIPDVLVVDFNLLLQFKSYIAQFKLLTIDWLVGTTVLAECVPQECSQITIDLFPDKIKNLKGKEIRVSALHYAPYVLLRPALDGSDIRMANEFARLHNCSWTIKGVPAIEEWGELYKNGTGTGILGAVVANKADIGLGGLFANLETFQFLTITSTYSQGRMTCLVPKPGEISTTFLPFRPFTITTWKTIFLTMIIASVALYISNKFVANVNFWRFGDESRPVYILNTYTTTLLLIFGMLVNQPPPAAKNVSVLSYFLTFIQLMFVIIATTYSSILAAIVTFPSYGKPIETARDLAESGMHWGATHNYWALDFMNSTIPHHKILLKNFQALSKEELRKHSYTGNFAFIIERLATDYYAVHDYITEDAAKRFVLMKEELYNDVTVVILKKGSPYTKAFNIFIGRVVSSGIFKYWESQVARQLFSPKVQQIITQSLSSVFRNPKVIQLKNLAGAFVLLLFGLILALIVFTIELRYKLNFLITLSFDKLFVR